MKSILLLLFSFIVINSQAQKDVDFFNKSEVEIENEDYKKALKYIKKAIKISPTNYKYHIQEGDVYLFMGNPKAYDSYTNAIFFEPKLSITYKARGDFLILVGDNYKAKKDYNKAIKYAENDSIKSWYYYSIN